MALSNSQFDAIMRIYNDRQLRARHEQDERLRHAYTLIPRLEEIAGEIASLSVNAARALLQENTGKPEGDSSSGKYSLHLRSAIARLSDERKALLLANHLPADYLELHHHCPYCRDTGFVQGRKCICFRKEEMQYLYAGVSGKNMPDAERFSNFSLDYYPEDKKSSRTALSAKDCAKHALFMARSFADQFHTRFQNLFFYGETGIGKSFLSHCIARELVSNGYFVLYLTAYELFDLLAQETFQNAGKDWSDSIFNADLLIIDDLGTELSNAFSASRLFLVVNERLLRKKHTVISTNLALEQLSKEYGERTASRIMSHYELIYLFGDDIRIQKQLSGGN